VTILLKPLEKFAAQKEKKEMKYRKTRSRDSANTTGLSEEIRERLDSSDEDTDVKIQMLACIFSGTEDYPEEFHQLYLQPLLDAGLTLENSLEMLVDGVLFPN
jgi:hypothetical protein